MIYVKQIRRLLVLFVLNSMYMFQFLKTLSGIHKISSQKINPDSILIKLFCTHCFKSINQ